MYKVVNKNQENLGDFANKQNAKKLRDELQGPDSFVERGYFVARGKNHPNGETFGKTN